MTRLSGTPLARITLFCSLPLVGTAPALCAAPPNDPVPYEGRGHVRYLGDPDSSARVEFFDLDGDQRFDLAHLDATGTLTIHERFMEYDRRSPIEGISTFAVTSTGADRLFAVQNGELVEIVREEDSVWRVNTIRPSSLSAITMLFPAELSGEPRLLVIDSAGLRASVVDASDGLVVSFDHWINQEDGVILDAALLDWDDDTSDDLALLTTKGLRVVNQQGTNLYIQDTTPDRAFIDVLPGAETQWGNDLLIFHHRVGPGLPAIMLAMNSNHSETLYVDPLLLEGVAIADVSSTPGSELILPCGYDRCAFVVKQFPTGTEAEPFLGIDWADTNLLDLRLGQTSTTTRPSSTTVQDLDGDGDQDLLFADDLGRGLVITSEWHDADDRRAYPYIETRMPPEELISQGEIQYQLNLRAPSGSSAVEVEVWYQANPESTDAPQFAWTTSLVVDENGQVNESITFPLQTAGVGIYFFSYRPIPAPGTNPPPFPTWVGAWSPDVTLHAELRSKEIEIYPWAPDPEDTIGAEGTTRRPIINPGGGPPGGPTD